MAQRTATIMICDAPHCYKESEYSDENPGEGYWIESGRWSNTGAGGPIVPAYACSAKHIGAAVEAAIDIEWHK